ncbi:MAG: hypothetical protein Q9204_005596 [Flavoplaca sp. TL-2023a]
MNQGQFYAPQGDSDYEQLFDAAHSSDNNALAAALTLPINVNALQVGTTRTQTALHIVASQGNLAAIQMLLRSGADFNRRDSALEVALHHAATGLHMAAVKALLDAGTPIGIRSGKYGHTALYNILLHKEVIGRQEIQMVELFLDRGADINEILEVQGSTLVRLTAIVVWKDILTLQQISKAAALRNLDLVQLLVKRDAIIPDGLLSNVKDYNVARCLLEHGAKIISDSDKDGSAIGRAATFGDATMLSLLLSYANNADLEKSQEALHHASYYGHVDVVNILIDQGIDVNTHVLSCVYGETALASACLAKEPNSEMVRNLLERGADITFRNTCGSTARKIPYSTTSKSTLIFRIVHCGAASSDPKTIQLLLDNGAEPSAQDLQGETPLTCAAYAMCHSRLPCPYDEDDLMQDAHSRCFRMILDATVDVNVQGRDGFTPLHALAWGTLEPLAAHGTLEAARTLMERGADLTIKNIRSETAADIFIFNDQYGILREKASGSDPHRYCYMTLLSPSRP